jgi:hypothetical protein
MKQMLLSMLQLGGVPVTEFAGTSQALDGLSV